MEVLTNVKMLDKGRTIHVTFTEYECNEKENDKRMEELRIHPAYQCTQLKNWRTLYRDSMDNPIKVLCTQMINV